jgi:hypothetical protein
MRERSWLGGTNALGSHAAGKAFNVFHVTPAAIHMHVAIGFAPLGAQLKSSWL